MATVELRGYVSRPEIKTSKAGKARAEYTVGVKQVEKAWGDRPESVTWANFRVTDFKATEAPPEKSYVTVSGFLKVREYEKDGQRRQALEVNAQTVDVSPPRDSGATPSTAPADEFAF